jgi:hypothetical protein
MSTWGSIYRVVRACHYNTGNVPVQPLNSKTRRSHGHYSPSVFTTISVLCQSQTDMCPLLDGSAPRDLRQFAFRGDLRVLDRLRPRDCLPGLRLNLSLAIKQDGCFLQNKCQRCTRLRCWPRFRMHRL